MRYYSVITVSFLKSDEFLNFINIGSCNNDIYYVFFVVGLVMNIFKLSEEDESYAIIDEELTQVTPSVKELVYSVASK